MGGLARKDVDALVNPNYGRIIASHWPRGAMSTVVVVGHEYFSPPQQQNAYLLLDALLTAAPSTPVLVEGRSGPRTASRWSLFGSAIGNAAKRQAAALEKLSVRGTQAAAILSELYPSTATIEGAEAAGQLEQQRERVVRLDQTIRDGLPASARETLMSGDFLDDAFTGVLGVMLLDLEELLNTRLKTLFDLERRFYDDLKPAAYATALGKLARDAGVDLEGYPVAHSLVHAAEMEKTLDFEAVERERMAVIERIAAESDRPLDATRATAVQAWMVSSPLPDGVALPAQAAAMGDLPPWLRHLIVLSQAYRDHKMSMAQYQIKLNGLLAALGITVDPRSLLAKYVQYVTAAEDVDVNTLITSELPALAVEIGAAMTTSANERGVLKLRDDHRALRRFHELSLPASRVGAFVAGKPSVTRWADEAVRLGDATLKSTWLSATSRATLPRVTAIVERTTPLLGEYYSAALERSRHVTKTAISRSAPASALVCGRFHLHEAMRALRADGNVAWAIVGPYPARDSGARKLRTWNWTTIDSEWSMPDRLPGAV